MPSMPDPLSDPPADPVTQRRLARQKTMLTALAIVLLLAGFVVLLALKKIPLPARLAMSFGDFVGAIALLMVLRQKFRGL
jgi:hypothetical protein